MFKYTLIAGVLLLSACAPNMFAGVPEAPDVTALPDAPILSMEDPNVKVVCDNIRELDRKIDGWQALATIFVPGNQVDAWKAQLLQNEQLLEVLGTAETVCEVELD